ncbi:MAG: RDD family protein [Chitinophagaceae bacterium]|nr:RDD family protein [Chitinophagaceae bacterium]
MREVLTSPHHSRNEHFFLEQKIGYSMSLLQVNTSFNIDLQFQTAPFHLRLFAWIVDMIMLYIYIFVLSYLFATTISLDNAQNFGLVELLIVIPYLAYHFVCELFMNGQSFGKKLLGVQVVSLNGKNASSSQYLLRWLLRTIDFGFFLGVVFLVSGNLFLGGVILIGSVISIILFITTPNNQRLGDFLAGTVVVMKKLPYNLNDTIFKELDVKNYKVVFPMVMRLSDKDINIINNALQKHAKSRIDNHLDAISQKIINALKIETTMESASFLKTLMRDYNYLTRQKSDD